jgi:hypothetical protein
VRHAVTAVLALLLVPGAAAPAQWMTVHDYPFEPLGAGLLKAGDGRWERQKNQQRPSS